MRESEYLANMHLQRLPRARPTGKPRPVADWAGNALVFIVVSALAILCAAGALALSQGCL